MATSFLVESAGCSAVVYRGRLLHLRGGVDSAAAKREKTVLGTIVAHEAWNHNQYRYSFVVNGASYLGLGHPPNEPSKIGDQVLVYYDPSNPAKNDLNDFADMATQVLGPVPLCLFGVFAVVFFVWRQRKKMAPPPLPSGVSG